MSKDITKFIPKNLQDQELWIKFRELVNEIINNPDNSSDDYIKKYTDKFNLPISLLDELMYEMGYAYILDIIKLSEENKREVILYVNIIDALKGHRTGLELVLDFLGFTYELTEWWEDPENLDPTTFKLVISDFGSGEVYSDLLVRLSRFIRKYVYPVMVSEVTTPVATFDNGISFGGFHSIFQESEGGFLETSFLLNITLLGASNMLETGTLIA